MPYELFTDGGCRPNPGRGASAYILKRGGRFLCQSVVAHDHVTNNQAELDAAVRGLARVPRGEAVTLYSDSSYVVSGLNEWRHAWKRYRWRNVANADLWRELDALADERVLTAVWVRGHDGHPENEDCDRLVAEAYRSGV